jgi:hypothetical protein
MPTRHPERKLERKSYQNLKSILEKFGGMMGPRQWQLEREQPIRHIVGVGSWTQKRVDFVAPRSPRGGIHGMG